MRLEKKQRNTPVAANNQETNIKRFEKIAVIGNYLPRQCGIATFTTDLSEALALSQPELEIITIPVNDTPEGYDYSDRARFEIYENDLSSYRHAANFLNINQVNAVCLQHEFGIYGGPAGSNILTLLQKLQMPIITVLHTILREPSIDQRKVMEGLVQYSDRLVVMSEMGAEILIKTYGVPKNKIDFIPHGIPDFTFIDPHFHKHKFGLEGKEILLTFGLMSESKGIDHVINAMPEIVAKHPNFVFIVLGATHPHIIKNEGESYRLSLERLVSDLNLDENVIFYNRFVELTELLRFIEAADIYVTPYLNEAQITSGTLAYAVGAGKAVISTPYWYAQELLDEERGVLFPFNDSEKITETILDLLDDSSKRQRIRRNAHQYGREMIWSKVAEKYFHSFHKSCKARKNKPRLTLAKSNPNLNPKELLKIDLRHLRRLTDSTGLFQHATFTSPNYDDGYTTDDNARGLLFLTLMEEESQLENHDQDLRARYFSFLAHAFNSDHGRFRNFMSYDRRWLENIGSQDSHGRSILALGTVIGRSKDVPLRNAATRLFHDALPALLHTTSCRTWAFSLLGLHEYLKRYAGDRLVKKIRNILCKKLVTLYETYSDEEWPWFEDSLTYANAVLPHALLISADSMNKPTLCQMALRSLEWLVEIQKIDKCFSPIGSDGFYHRSGNRARFDQQPTEAQAMISACLEAFNFTKDTKWWIHSKWVFEWYLGQNDLSVQLYDPATGACRDGLHADRPNENRGAESTLAFLQSLIEMHSIESMINVSDIRYETKSSA